MAAHSERGQQGQPLVPNRRCSHYHGTQRADSGDVRNEQSPFAGFTRTLESRTIGHAESHTRRLTRRVEQTGKL